MTSLIESLREKSTTTRHMIAFGTSVVVTIVIAFVWMTTTYPGMISGGTMARENGSTSSATPVTGASQSASVFNSSNSASTNSSNSTGTVSNGSQINFRQNLAQSFAAVKNQWNSIVTYFSETEYEAENRLRPLEVLPAEKTSAN